MADRLQPRRTFLKQSAALAAAGVLVNPGVSQNPNDRVRVAVIGINGQGAWNLGQLESTGLAEIVALCDVDETRSAPILRARPNARFYTDYRQLLERERDNIQAVLIATPDHHHAIPALTAMRAGKHVYCEKPLAHSVHEVRAMMDAAERNRVVTQMGTQIHAQENYHRVVELIRAGVIGPVRRVHVWCSRRADALHRADPIPVPQGLHYDLWLGPAPEVGYPPFRLGNSTTVHFNWRWSWDYGGGVLADMACHFMDLPHWALGLRQPTSVVANGRVAHNGDNRVPDILTVDYNYPARGEQPAVHLTWYSGVDRPAVENIDFAGFGSGVLFVGDNGQLLSDYTRHRLLPEGRAVELPARTLARSPGHHREWLVAIKEGRTTSCPFSYSGALAETVLLGNVAYRSGNGTRLQYDAATGRVTNDVADAARYLRREYRTGWTL